MMMNRWGDIRRIPSFLGYPGRRRCSIIHQSSNHQITLWKRSESVLTLRHDDGYDRMLQQHQSRLLSSSTSSSSSSVLLLPSNGLSSSLYLPTMIHGNHQQQNQPYLSQEVGRILRQQRIRRRPQPSSSSSSSSTRWFSTSETTSTTKTSTTTTSTTDKNDQHQHQSPPSPTTFHRRHHRHDPSSSSSSQAKKIDFDYCIDLVQNRDRESYLCGLLMPYESRKPYFAIRAFNVELASMKDGSSGSIGGRRMMGSGLSGSNVGNNNRAVMTGGGPFSSINESTNNNNDSGGTSSLALKVRMQWWRDAIHQIYAERDDDDDDHDSPSMDGGGAVVGPDNDENTHDGMFQRSMAASYYKNPIVRVLDYAVQEKDLTRRFLERLLEGRENDLDNHQPDTVEDMVRYADNVFSSLLYLSLETMNVRDEGADIVAQHAGIGIGLITALRGTRYLLGKGEIPIPKELIGPTFPYHKLFYDTNDGTEKTHPSVGGSLAEQEYRILQEAVQHVADLARMHLNRARDLQNDIPKHGRTCLLPMVPALHYLSRLEKVDYNILDDTLLVQHHLTILGSLGRVWLTGVL